MAVIKKKTWPEYFEAVASGKKTFELRVQDFDVKEGDTLILEEWNPETREYTGRRIEREVTYVLKDVLTQAKRLYPKEEIEKFGFQIISLREPK